MSAPELAPVQSPCALLFEKLGQVRRVALKPGDLAVVLAPGCPPQLLDTAGYAEMRFTLPVDEPALSLPKLVAVLPGAEATQLAALSTRDASEMLAYLVRHARAIRETGAGLQ